jgi:hypothetical protein
LAERLLVTEAFAVRLDYQRAAQADRELAERVAEILCRPSFDALEVVSGRGIKSNSKYVSKSVDAVLGCIRDERYDFVSLQSKDTELVGCGSLGTTTPSFLPASALLTCSLAQPVVDDVVRFLTDVSELAGVLDTSAGFVAIEPTVLRAYKLASGASLPDPREGLSEERRRARRARDWNHQQVGTALPSIEWGTFLGAGHLAQVDIERLRASNAFERVVEISPSLAFLQMTSNPLDDLTGELERRLFGAREILQPLLMDISDVNLE